ncbi:transglutaminase domain-containing protein [Thermomicrobium sp. 4228-Ro]|uniref:transglutaminase domain-containing protein n=1 Tax=Thermomicrobium sp. 4228-Ro TaxID=2993937 RepID=UPI002248DD90|nr:transglutaminase domain-containing protein [Thermomicrobium sp. 4228-Ro]MCX2726190.1 transglutaminase domain-containing protein [Thermomicrobium sp. 4228-Ro]
MGRILWRRLTPDTGWFAFSLLAVLCLLAGVSTYRADWSDGLGIAVRAVLVGIVLAYLLAKPLAFPEWIAHPVGVSTGAVAVLWLMQGLLSDQIGDWRAKLSFLWIRWERWYLAVREGGRAEDVYLFLLLIAATHLAIGYIATWLLVRHNHAWFSVLLPTVVILINAGYSRHVSAVLVAIAVIIDLLIVGRVTLMHRVRLWRRRAVPVASGLTWQSLWVLSWLAVAILIAGWIVPFGTHSSRAAAALRPTSRPWTEVRDTLARWFPSVRGPGGTGRGAGGFASFGDRFDIGGPLRLSDEAVLLLSGNRGEYLTVRTYDTYTGKGWRSSAVPEDQTAEGSSSGTPGASGQSSEPVPLVEFGANDALPRDHRRADEQETVTYRIEVLQPRGAALPYAGRPVSFSIPVRALYGWTGTTEWHTIDLSATGEEDIPVELRPLTELLARTEFRPAPEPEGSVTITPSRYENEPWFWWFMRDSPVLDDIDSMVRDLTARGIEVRFWWETNGDGAFRITRIAYRGRFPDYADLEAVYPADGLERGLTYEFVSESDPVSAEDLRKVGSGEDTERAAGDLVMTAYGVAYPRDLYERYTQLPDTVTARTRQLAYTLAEGRSNLYDIATTIEQFVRQRIAYNESAPVPSGIDAVDTILFERPEGYCTFYASSMAVLLRILGIPARVAVGYYPAEYDSELGGFIYRDRNAHAWVEVYFPGYGWVPFEPTASRPPLPRETSTASGDLLPLDPTLGANLPTDERLGLLLPELGGPERAGAVGSAAVDTSEPHPVRNVLLVLLALIGAGIAGAMLWWTWGTWRLSPIARLFVRMQRLARLAGVQVGDATTPLELAWEIGRTVPGTRRAAVAIAELYMRERYGRQPAKAEEIRVVARGWREIVRPRLIRAVLRLSQRQVAATEVSTPGSETSSFRS